MDFLFGQGWDGFLDKSSDLFPAFLLLGYTYVLLLHMLAKPGHDRTITAMNMLKKTSALSVGLSSRCVLLPAMNQAIKKVAETQAT